MYQYDMYFIELIMCRLEEPKFIHMMISIIFLMMHISLQYRTRQKILGGKKWNIEYLVLIISSRLI